MYMYIKYFRSMMIQGHFMAVWFQHVSRWIMPWLNTPFKNTIKYSSLHSIPLSLIQIISLVDIWNHSPVKNSIDLPFSQKIGVLETYISKFGSRSFECVGGKSHIYHFFKEMIWKLASSIPGTINKRNKEIEIKVICKSWTYINNVYLNTLQP